MVEGSWLYTPGREQSPSWRIRKSMAQKTSMQFGSVSKRASFVYVGTFQWRAWLFLSSHNFDETWLWPELKQNDKTKQMQLRLDKRSICSVKLYLKTLLSQINFPLLIAIHSFEQDKNAFNCPSVWMWAWMVVCPYVPCHWLSTNPGCTSPLAQCRRGYISVYPVL